jgi:hypothetical protein
MDLERAVEQEARLYGDGEEIMPIDWIDLEAGGQLLTYERRAPRANGDDVLVQRHFVVYPQGDGEAVNGLLSSRWENLGGKRGEPRDDETPQSA